MQRTVSIRLTDDRFGLGQQPIHGQSTLRCDKNFSVDHDRDRELDWIADVVSCAKLDAVIQLGAQVIWTIGVENAGCCAAIHGAAGSLESP